MNEKIIDKFLSGRFLLTVIAGLVFAWAVYKNLLPPAATSAILVSVFKDYFGKNLTNGGIK